MSRSSKWLLDAKQDPDDPLYAVFFTARNKDNKNIDGFHQRKRSFLYHIPDNGIIPGYDRLPGAIKTRFDEFANEGLSGELSRLYISVNPRNPEKIKRMLMHSLIDDNLPTETPLAHMETVMVSFSMRKGMGMTRRWMFDFDSEDEELLEDFENNILHMPGINSIETYHTPHGFAVITEHGFDMRQLDDKWQQLMTNGKQENIITLKRDDLICVYWQTR